MITTFGEIMLRISPIDVAVRIIQADTFDIRPGGSESNVAIALENLGLKNRFVTSLPGNTLGEKIIRYLKTESVNTDFIILSGDRIGMYWTENGSGPRNSFVIYDRENSAFSNAQYDDYSWDKILENTTWFHFSGISPAVSKNVAELLQKVVDRITCPYSVDLNYRNKLWQWVGQDKAMIKDVMHQLCTKATLIAGNETDFQNVFSLYSDYKDPGENFRQISEQCFKLFPHLKYIAISQRISHSASQNDWSGFLFVRNDTNFMYKGMDYRLDNIKDRVGTGDSFVAGVIYGLQKETDNPQYVIDFATTLGALNHTTKGDASNFSVEEVLSTMSTKGSGRIIR